jgi:indolepyruvate ferredoxin oxidoreductase
MPTGDFTRNRDADLKAGERLARISGAVDGKALQSLDANALSEALLGDTVFANVLMLGAAWQAGLVPLTEAALMRAIELNGVKPELNKQAFAWGRVAVTDHEGVERIAGIEARPVQTLEQMIDRRADFLGDYQSRRWARRYRDDLQKVIEAETRVAGAPGALSEAAAKGLFKLMSYKDEYEVARLHAQTGFLDGLKDRFEGEFTVRHHLAPPILSSGTDARGRPLKRSFGPWVQVAFRQLARMKRLRGTVFDPFGRTGERRMERALIGEYRALLDRLVNGLTSDNRDEAARIAGLVMEIRGFGPVKEEATEKTRKAIAEAITQYAA